MFGVDYVGGPGISVLKANGVSFVCRYLCWLPNSKVIGRAEYQSLIGSGIYVVLNWEFTANAMLNGYQEGVSHATESNRQCAALGAPTAPVYFSADFDATPAQQAGINSYLDGCAHVLGKGRVGVYGSYWVVKRALDGGHCTFGWQTYAWSGGNWDTRAHIQQYRNGVRMGTAEVDYDRSMHPDFGQNPRPGVPHPPPPPAPPVPGAKAPAFPYPGGDYMSVASPDPHCHSGYYAADQPHVRTWQAQMGHRGWTISADGHFGPQSLDVCRKFQAEKHLAIDGKVGPATWSTSWTAPLT